MASRSAAASEAGSASLSRERPSRGWRHVACWSSVRSGGLAGPGARSLGGAAALAGDAVAADATRGRGCTWSPKQRAKTGPCSREAIARGKVAGDVAIGARAGCKQRGVQWSRDCSWPAGSLFRGREDPAGSPRLTASLRCGTIAREVRKRA
jgi:hypothetical protein